MIEIRSTSSSELVIFPNVKPPAKPQRETTQPQNTVEFELGLMLFGNSRTESQRDSGLKPRVARNELPRDIAARVNNPNGVAARPGKLHSRRRRLRDARQVNQWLYLLLLAAIAVVVFMPPSGGAQNATREKSAVTIEYIAHACFRVTSPSGKQVLIDPYASRVWLGYDFPTDIRADAVLISHPRYDHDGWAKAEANVRYLPAHRQDFSFDKLPQKPQVLIFKHSPLVIAPTNKDEPKK